MTSPCHGPAVPDSASGADEPAPCHPVDIRQFRQLRWRRRIILFLAFAVMFAGFAQAAHYHKGDPGRRSTYVHCVLCLFAAGGATPPSGARAMPPRALCFCSDRCSVNDAGPLSSEAALYDARGPPAA